MGIGVIIGVGFTRDIMQSKEPITLETLAATLGDVITELRSINARLDKLETDQREFAIRLDAQQKAMQWVVNLAFALIVSSTVALILSALRLYLPDPPV